MAAAAIDLQTIKICFPNSQQPLFFSLSDYNSTLFYTFFLDMEFQRVSFLQ